MRVLPVALALLALGCVEAEADKERPPRDRPDRTEDTAGDTTPPDDSGDTTEWDPYAVDSDGDGLSDGEEAELGTDPGATDSDGDGFGDAEELEGNTDPTDADDRPYAGGWTIDACRDDIRGEGYAVGDVSTDWSLSDQYGEDVRLHDFCDRVVWMVFAAFW